MHDISFENKKRWEYSKKKIHNKTLTHKILMKKKKSEEEF